MYSNVILTYIFLFYKILFYRRFVIKFGIYYKMVCLGYIYFSKYVLFNEKLYEGMDIITLKNQSRGRRRMYHHRLCIHIDM